MSTPYDQQIDELMAKYRRQRDEMARVQRELKDITVTVTEPKRVVSITVGRQGEVISLSFPTQRYRKMAPAELASALQDTITQARSKVMEKIAETMSPLLPKGLSLSTLIDGRTLPEDPPTPEEYFRSMEP